MKLQNKAFESGGMVYEEEEENKSRHTGSWALYSLSYRVAAPVN